MRIIDLSIASHLRLILVLILMALSGQSLARTYIVEAIIFSNEGASGLSDEIWDAKADRTLRKQSKINTLYNAAKPTKQTFGLPRLASIRDKLNNSPEYRVLQTLSWSQSEANYARSRLTKVSAFNLLGSIRIYAPNLLFAELNLQYAPVDSVQQDLSLSPQYYLIEKRKLKLNETHYFDHPKFGVILNVRPAN